MKTHEIKTFRKTYKQYIKPCVFNGYKLAVLFDEKDTVKSLGARWDNDEQIWWIPKDMLKQNDGRGPGNIHEYLNANSMIVGQYGGHADVGYVEQNGTPKMYSLGYLDGNAEMISVAWYEEYDAIRFSGPSTDSRWYTVEKGREKWDALIQDGYARMHGTHPENSL